MMYLKCLKVVPEFLVQCIRSFFFNTSHLPALVWVLISTFAAIHGCLGTVMSGQQYSHGLFKILWINLNSDCLYWRLVFLGSCCR